MSTEAAVKIQRLLDQTDKQTRERNNRLELVRESCVLATGILKQYGQTEAETAPNVIGYGNASTSTEVKSRLKTPNVPIAIGSAEGNIYLEQSWESSTGNADNRGLWIYFEQAGPIPFQRPLKLLFYLDKHSASSPEGTLKTPSQFARLKQVLGFIKTSLESSPSKK